MNAETTEQPKGPLNDEGLAALLDRIPASAPSAETAEVPNAGEETAGNETESETPSAEAEEPGPAEEASEVHSQEEESNEADTEPTEAETGQVELSKEARQVLGKVVADRLGKAASKFNEKLSAAEQKAAEAEAKRAELEAKLAELENRPAEATPAIPMDASNPLAEIKDPAELAKRERQAQAVLDDIDALLPELTENPEAVAAKMQRWNIKLTDAEGQPDYTERRMRAWLERTRLEHDKLLKRYIPAQQRALQSAAEFRQIQRQADAQAETDFPWLKDAKDQRTQKVAAVLKANPMISRFVPDARLFLAAAMETLATKAGKVKVNPPVAKAKTPAAKPQVPATKAAAKPPGRDPKTAKLDEALKRLKEDGSDDNYALVLDALG